ncbi:MAG TPA: single-stranded DNA-binding protein [Thauera aminoaromatica]|nr:single-stranded DNA-binding protein [Thauera aminoaromatica]
MSSVNKVILLGNLGKAPELKNLPSGQTVCNFSIATSETYKDKNEQKQERTEWHNIVVWGKTGENCAKYLDKGSKVYIEGKIQTRTWDDKEGKKQYRTEINAMSIVFLDGRSGGGGPRPSNAPDNLPPADDEIPF